MKMIEMSFGLAKRQNVNMEYPKTWYHVWQEENVILFIILVLDIYKKGGAEFVRTSKALLLPEVMTTQKEINKRVYYRHKNNGECPRCGKPLDRNGHYCSECLVKVREYNRENRRFYAENQLCTVCGKVNVPKGERICPECRAKIKNRKPLTEEQKTRYASKFREQQKILYKQRAELGICTRCGKHKAMPGKKKCGICLEKDAEIHRRKNMDRPNIKEYRKENHLCYFCGNPVDMERGQLCQACHEKCRQNGLKGSHNNVYWRQENRLIFAKKQ